MRSHEERVAAVKQRVAQIERQKRQRRNRLLALSSVASCLAVIVGCPLPCPEFRKNWLPETIQNMKQRRVFLAAVPSPDISSLGFWPLSWACA